MKCKILHESAGRMRVHLNCRRMTLHQADVLEYYLRNVDGVREVSVFDRTQDAVIVYRADRAALVHALAAFSFDKAETMDLVVQNFAFHSVSIPPKVWTLSPTIRRANSTVNLKTNSRGR